MVALSGSWRPPPNTQAPAACSSALNASTALKVSCISSSDIWGGVIDASWWTESMYCVIGISSSDGTGTVPALTPSTNGVLPNRHAERDSWGARCAAARRSSWGGGTRMGEARRPEEGRP